MASEQQGGVELLITRGTKANVQLIYLLYLGAFFGGLTGLIGLVMAYVNKTDAPDWLYDHYVFQIRTFWIALGVSIVGWMLSIILIGFVILFLTAIWVIIRCVQGLDRVSRGVGPDDPRTWGFL